ncbi:phosphoglycerate mutase family protein [Dokdonia sp.]|uniref:SixA phosphatase family protein n=1 Tax=Dokdonia sp. TaxID=2024995 RepID=UPI00326450FB
MRYLFLPILFFMICFTSCKEAKTTPPVEVATPEVAITTTTYYLIRHAEKDRSDPENRNPSLKEEGIARAQQWSEVFKDVTFDMVYSTNYARTQETATPTAKRKGLEIKSYDPRTPFDATFEKETLGKTVLVVGHSNTTPMFTNAILKEEQFAQIDDTNNGNLYIVTVTGDERSAQLLHVD